MKYVSNILKMISLIAVLWVNPFADNDPEINWRDNPNADIEFHKLADHPLFGRMLSKSYSLADVDTMLVSASYMNRGLAAMVLAKGTVADTARCVDLLIKALTSEVNRPTSNNIAIEVDLPITDFLKNQYRAAIRFLLYKGGASLLTPYIEKVEGNAKSMLIIMGGILGERSKRQDIRNIYLKNEDGYVRAAAVEVMNMFPDSSDVPVLQAAMKDNYFTVDKFGNNIFQIRGTAIGALSKLGFTVEEIEQMYNNER